MKAILLYLMSISLAFAAEESGRFQNMVRLKEAEAALLKLETAEAEETAFEETVFALGEIEVLPGKRAVVSSRIAGRAFSVLVIPSQEIAEGDEVAWIESRQPGDPPPTVMLPSPTWLARTTTVPTPVSVSVLPLSVAGPLTML